MVVLVHPITWNTELHVQSIGLQSSHTPMAAKWISSAAAESVFHKRSLAACGSKRDFFLRFFHAKARIPSTWFSRRRGLSAKAARGQEFKSITRWLVHQTQGIQYWGETEAVWEKDMQQPETTKAFRRSKSFASTPTRTSSQFAVG